MQNIFISIIVPVYNVEQYIHECLDSIAQLKAFEWEAILVDDGSTDASGSICDEYARRESRFRVIHQTNSGVSAARNAGLEAARGEWIWFVDSDDTINPDFEIVNPESMASADYVMFELRKFKDGEAMKSLAHQKGEVCDEQLDKNDILCKYQCNHHQRLFYKKTWVMIGNLHQRLAFTKGLRVGEDLEFQYKFLIRCKHPAKLNAVLYNYRLREGSATQDLNYRRKNVEDLPIVIEHLLEFCREERVKPEPWLEMRIRQMFQNLLYSASQVSELDINSLQMKVRRLLDAYREQGFVFPNVPKMRLAYWSVKAYFAINRAYLRLKGIS